MHSMEQWRDIAGFEGYYQVSDLGRVKSLARTVEVKTHRGAYMRPVRERILRPGLQASGHGRVTLWLDFVKSIESVHVLVLEAFSGPRPDGHYGCHRDDDPANNRLTNLYWGTPTQNCADKIRLGNQPKGDAIPWSKLKPADVIRIRSLKGSVSQSKLGREYGVRQGHISRIQSGKAWGHAQ